jgi:hypothetical protein
MKQIISGAIKGVTLLGILCIQAHGVGVPYNVLEQEALSSGTSTSQVVASTTPPATDAAVEKLKEDERRLSAVVKELQEDSAKLKASMKETPRGSDLH